MVNDLMLLAVALFPGIDFYSLSGLHQVVSDLITPVLKKIFPELINDSGENIKKSHLLEVSVFLPSKGYEWQDSIRWQKKFEKLINEQKKN